MNLMNVLFRQMATEYLSVRQRSVVLISLSLRSITFLMLNTVEK